MALARELLAERKAGLEVFEAKFSQMLLSEKAPTEWEGLLDQLEGKADPPPATCNENEYDTGILYEVSGGVMSCPQITRGKAPKGYSHPQGYIPFCYDEDGYDVVVPAGYTVADMCPETCYTCKSSLPPTTDMPDSFTAAQIGGTCAQYAGAGFCGGYAILDIYCPVSCGRTYSECDWYPSYYGDVC